MAEDPRDVVRTVVADGPDDLALRVAEAFRDVVRASTRPVFVALAGGSTPKRLYELLAGSPFRESIAWERVEFLFGDERAVPADHADSNWRMAREALLARIPSRAHRMEAETGNVEAYEEVLEWIPDRRGVFPVLDVVLLGLGTDGHTASLFPRTAALDERRRPVVMNDVPALATNRMTLTYPVLNAARRVWILAAGEDKRDVVERCLASYGREGAYQELPVVGVRPYAGELVWWLDRRAAPQVRT